MSYRNEKYLYKSIVNPKQSSNAFKLVNPISNISLNNKTTPSAQPPVMSQTQTISIYNNQSLLLQKSINSSNKLDDLLERCRQIGNAPVTHPVATTKCSEPSPTTSSFTKNNSAHLVVQQSSQKQIGTLSNENKTEEQNYFILS
jgi:hypothetical protein